MKVNITTEEGWKIYQLKCGTNNKKTRSLASLLSNERVYLELIFVLSKGRITLNLNPLPTHHGSAHHSQYLIDLVEWDTKQKY